MTIIATMRRVAANLLAIGSLAALLSACTLTSETLLVTPDEAVQPLSTGFAMTGYKDEDGAITKGEDAPVTFALARGGYLASDDSFTVYFLPTELADTFVLALAGADGATYGIARLRDNILEVAVLFDEDPAEQAAAAGVALPAGVTVDDGGMMVTDRATLDAVIALVREGKLKLSSFVSWVGPAESAPAALKRDGDWYVAG